LHDENKNKEGVSDSEEKNEKYLNCCGYLHPFADIIESIIMNWK
jgi:hypothetical protein